MSATRCAGEARPGGVPARTIPFTPASTNASIARALAPAQDDDPGDGTVGGNARNQPVELEPKRQIHGGAVDGTKGDWHNIETHQHIGEHSQHVLDLEWLRELAVLI